MNSLNILSRVTPSSSPTPSRSNSLSHVGLAPPSSTSASAIDNTPTSDKTSTPDEKDAIPSSEPKDAHTVDHPDDHQDEYSASIDEKTPLLFPSDSKAAQRFTWTSVPVRVTNSLINSVTWVLSTIISPGVYLYACLCDEQGYFAPFRQLKALFGIYEGDAHKFVADYQENVALGNKSDFGQAKRNGQGNQGHFTSSRPSPSSGSSSSGLSSESESELSSSRGSSLSRHARSKSLQPSDESLPSRRSMRIKFNNEDGREHMKHKKAQSVSAKPAPASSDLSAQLKSPTSPIGALTKYPRTPAPPRPLIPRRQPSYAPMEPEDPKQLKTLIIDLDETLIHSMSKGGRMGSGHMVEVRLNTTYVASGGQQSLGPQHPILYYVHKRPHCDEFLRKVCKWFNLVVFTASVQEYADPVIDWLESERKYFSARYYRQHCTFRHGAFIKDLSSVEPDLSNVMILDNSPLSYMFHQDNAIPIQGWINDPTDNDLLHLVPFLEGLQYVSDVRALLALRVGEDGQYPA